MEAYGAHGVSAPMNSRASALRRRFDRIAASTPHRPRRRHEVVSVAYDAGDGLPVRTAVDPDAYPTLVTDVRRSEESHRVLIDEGLLQPGGHCEPDRDVLGAVMVRVHLGEDLSHPPGELAPGDLLSDAGQREADAPQAFDGAVLCLRARPFERMLADIRGPGRQRSRARGAGHAVEVSGGLVGCHREDDEGGSIGWPPGRSVPASTPPSWTTC